MPAPWAPGQGPGASSPAPPAPAAGSLWTYGNLVEKAPPRVAPSQQQVASAGPSAAFQDLFAMSRAQVESVQRNMFRAGLFGKTPANRIRWGEAGDPDTMAAFTGVLNYAKSRQQASGNLTTWQDSLNSLVHYGPSADAAKPAYKGPVTTTATDLANNGDAYSTLLQAMTSLLGRSPTSTEVSKFQGVLNAAERANPVTTTETPTKFGPNDEVISKKVVRKGGVDRGVQAQQFVQANNGQEGASYHFWNLMRTFEKELRGGG